MFRHSIIAISLVLFSAMSAQAGGLNDPKVEPAIIMEDAAGSSGNGTGLLIATLVLAVLVSAADR